MQDVLLKLTIPVAVAALALYGYFVLTELFPSNKVRFFISPAVILIWALLQLVFVPNPKIVYGIVCELVISVILVIFQLLRVANWVRLNERSTVRFAARFAKRAYQNTDNSELQKQQRGEMCSVLLSMLYLANMPVAMMDSKRVCQDLLRLFQSEHSDDLIDECSSLSNLSKDRFDTIYANTLCYLEQAAGDY